MDQSYQKIILPTHPQADTILAIFLLKKFGKEKYPEIEKAKIEVWNSLPKNAASESLSKKGFFLIDIGGGKFDHHFKEKRRSSPYLCRCAPGEANLYQSLHECR